MEAGMTYLILMIYNVLIVSSVRGVHRLLYRASSNSSTKLIKQTQHGMLLAGKGNTLTDTCLPSRHFVFYSLSRGVIEIGKERYRVTGGGCRNPN